MVERLVGIGVEEIWCLVDLGVDVDLALESLHYTNVLRQRYEPASERGPSSENQQKPESIDIHTIEHAAAQHSGKVRNLPMTEGQKQLWALAQISDDANCGYNESIMLDMRGHFDVEAMRKSLQQIVDRHEALRITFDPNGEHQSIHSSVKFAIPLLDLSHLTGPECQAEFEVWSAAEMSKPFNLAQGPLFRFRLARLEPEHHILVFTYHHTIVDG